MTRSAASAVPAPLGPLPGSLKEVVKLIQDRERGGAMISHQLGVLYAHVLREELYVDAGYRDFWIWVEKGMGRDRGYVRKLLAMVNAFPDEKEVLRIGATSARIIATVADEKVRKRLADAAKRGASAPVIERKVQKLRQRDRSLKAQPTKKRGRALKYVEVDALIAFQRALELGKPVKMVDGLTVEVRRAGAGRFTLHFARSF